MGDGPEARTQVRRRASAFCFPAFCFPDFYFPTSVSTAMPTNGPVRLGDVLEEVIDRLGVRPKINEARVVEAWHTRAGPKIEEVTTSAWMKGATLFVKISSAAWRQELHMNRRTWAQRLNDELGQEIVDEIVFR